MRFREIVLDSKSHEKIKRKLQDIERRSQPDDQETRDKEYAAHIERMKQQQKEYLKKNPQSIYKQPTEDIEESKQRLDDKCWKGYRKQGTKMKGDTRVNNCVPVKESEIVKEGPSLPTTIQTITTDINDSVTATYNTLKTMAEKFYHNNGQLKGFSLISAGVGRRWVDLYYFNKIQADLYSLVQYLPTSTVPLKKFLDLNLSKFSEITNELPEILLDTGVKIKSEQLVKAAKNWIRIRQDFNNFIDQLEVDTDDQPSYSATTKTNTTGQQQSQVEPIVNDVLKSLPTKIAGEIRNSIARSGNKLQALKSELDKRGIKLNGS